MWKYVSSSINLFHYVYKNLIIRKLKENELKM
jgi:hypothetical protein